VGREEVEAEERRREGKEGKERDIPYYQKVSNPH
jgi:hypothetical protein